MEGPQILDCLLLMNVQILVTKVIGHFRNCLLIQMGLGERWRSWIAVSHWSYFLVMFDVL